MKIGIFAPLDQFLTDIVNLWKEQGHEIMYLPSVQDPAMTLTSATQFDINIRNTIVKFLRHMLVRVL